jgi:hypothetical protein
MRWDGMEMYNEKREEESIWNICKKVRKRPLGTSRLKWADNI